MSDNSTQTENKASFKRKTNGYKSFKMNAKRDRKRQEAEIRNEKHNALTTQQKIAKATKRGGSVRELARLNKALALEKKESEIKKATSPNPPTEAVSPSKPVVKKATKKKS